MALNYKAIIKALMPKGVAWNPDIENDFDKFLEAYAGNSEVVYEDLRELATLRNPQTTGIENGLDLIREYGLVLNAGYSEQQARDLLSGVMFAKPGTGSFNYLQTILTSSGFDVIVTPNDPAINPNLILAQAGFMWADFGTSRADYIEAVTNGPTEIIVNCHDDSPENYRFVDGDPSRWNYVFFVGGVASGWPGSPSIAFVDLPLAQRGAFVDLILKYKPLHTWCVPVINWV